MIHDLNVCHTIQRFPHVQRPWHNSRQPFLDQLAGVPTSDGQSLFLEASQKCTTEAERDICYDYNIMMLSIFHGWHFALNALRENLFFFCPNLRITLMKTCRRKEATQQTRRNQRNWRAACPLSHGTLWAKHNIFFFHKDGNMSWKKGDYHMS